MRRSPCRISARYDPATFDPQQLAQQRLANPYNAWQLKLPGYGVVREVRKIDLKQGENTMNFPLKPE